jgi:hypothetical protein
VAKASRFGISGTAGTSTSSTLRSPALLQSPRVEIREHVGFLLGSAFYQFHSALAPSYLLTFFCAGG